MCGIAGFIDYNNSSSVSILEECTDVLFHRGPDGSGYEFFQEESCQVGLGHRRLSVIDLTEAGKQPMWYKHLCVVFNGEIYNYAELKCELEKLGHRFVSHSDTEVILHAWEEWKELMVTKFIGMFAIVIYDSDKKEIHCFRDRAGIKPFYYYWHDGLFLFASELKSFHKHKSFKKEINKQAVYQFIQYGFIMTPLSIFDHTFNLLPGHYLHFDLRKKAFKIEKYWDVYDSYNHSKLDISEQEATKHIEELLISACNYRMIADVPVGIFLSGGYDSTAITALLHKHQEKKLKTFTIGFHEASHNEAAYAKDVASYLNTDHTEYYCTTKEAQEIIPEIPFFCDEPFGDSSIIPTILVSRLARKDVTVALSADAGDELFGGYFKYSLAIDYLKKIKYLPGTSRKYAGRLLKLLPNPLINSLTKSHSGSIKKDRFADLLVAPDITAPLIMDHLISQTYSSQQMRFLLSDNIIKPESFFNSELELKNTKGQLDKMFAIDYKTYLPNDILVKVDRASMSASLEAREPLLDHRLLEFVAQLPEHLKIKNGNKKYLLKQVVHDYVPKKMMDRPKMGFGVPVSKWLRNELKHYTYEYLSDKELEKHGLFRKEAVRNIISRFFEGDANYDGLYWHLLMFQMWYRKWID